jgi:hypothetical protein
MLAAASIVVVLAGIVAVAQSKATDDPSIDEAPSPTATTEAA